MEKQNTSLKKDEQLLQARQEALHKAESTSIRPHGKFWEMDVFSWFTPDIQHLATTIQAFPFPVIWIGNSAVMQEVIALDQSITTQLHAVFATDNARFAVDLTEKSWIRTITGTNAIEDALALIKGVKQKNTVLLFTASDEDWQHSKLVFEEFLKTNRSL